MNYLIAAVKAQPADCHLEAITNVPNDHHLRFGVPRAQDFPPDATFRMDGAFPKGLRLTDALDNIGGLLVASVRLREFLESIPGALFQNEILPVKIVNHKGRTEKAQYVIIHQIDHPACVDEQETAGERFPVNPDRYQFVDKLVLDEKKIDERLMLFRAAQFPSVLLVRDDLSEKLEAAKFTGLSLFEIDEFEFL